MLSPEIRHIGNTFEGLEGKLPDVTSIPGRSFCRMCALAQLSGEVHNCEKKAQKAVP